MLVVEIPYESQKNYTLFYLQFQRFLLLTSFGVLHPLPKGRGLARKIDETRQTGAVENRTYRRGERVHTGAVENRTYRRSERVHLFFEFTINDPRGVGIGKSLSQRIKCP